MRWLADENFNHDVIRGWLRQCPDLDLVCIQDLGLRGCDDPTVLARAASENRILLTHDVTTVTYFAYRRVHAGLGMPGVFAVRFGTAIGAVIEDLLLLEKCSIWGEWEGQIVYLPLRA